MQPLLITPFDLLTYFGMTQSHSISNLLRGYTTPLQREREAEQISDLAICQAAVGLCSLLSSREHDDASTGNSDYMYAWRHESEIEGVRDKSPHCANTFPLCLMALHGNKGPVFKYALAVAELRGTPVRAERNPLRDRRD